jgi:hypothetical protein
MLDLVNPLRALGRLGNEGRDTWFDSARPLRRLTGAPQHAEKMASDGLAGKRLVDYSERRLARLSSASRTRSGSVKIRSRSAMVKSCKSCEASLVRLPA